MMDGRHIKYDYNRTSPTRPIRVLTYDSRNRLIATDKGGAQIDMAYDPDGIRVQKVVDGEATDYLVDSNRAYAQVLYERSGSGELGYTFGTDLVGLGTGSESYSYQTDALGSTRLLTDVDGIVADTPAYDAWGVQLSGGNVAENQYLYTGEQFDFNLAQIYLRARYMDAQIGRFTQMDVWRGQVTTPISLNKYLYGASDPVLYLDPTGKFFSIGSMGAAFRIGVAGSVAGAKAGVGIAGRLMGRLAVQTLQPFFRAVGNAQLTNAAGRSITVTDKLKRFFVSPTKGHPGVNWGPIGRWLKKAFPSAKWEQHHVLIQSKWFRKGSPSQWYPKDVVANRGLQRLGNAGFNLMSLPQKINGALGRSAAATAGLAIGSYSLVTYATSAIFEAFDAFDN